MILVLLLALAATGDSLLVGVSYGVGKARVTWEANALASAICFLGTWASMSAGRLLGELTNPRVSQLLGGLVLLMMGILMVRSALRNRRQACRGRFSAELEVIDRDRSSAIEPGEAAALGAALCVNNLGLGLGASLMGVSPLWTSLCCGVMNFVFLQAGCALGRRIKESRFAQWTEAATALAILFLGVVELLQ